MKFSFSNYLKHRNPLVRLNAFLFVFLSILLMGSTGYVLIEGARWFDALYMTLISVTTVGFGEVFPLSKSGRIWTMLMIVTGMSYLGIAISQIVTFIVEGEILNHFSKSRRDKYITRMKNHVIICGLGRTGLAAFQKFSDAGIECVLIELESKINESFEHDSPILKKLLIGDATQDGVLLKAGIKDANILLAAAGNDLTNLFVVLSARNLNHDLKIIARVSEAENTRKMKLAGATEVVCLFTLGGKHMAEMASTYLPKNSSKN